MSKQIFTGSKIDPTAPGEQLWDAIIDIFADWFNTDNIGDGDGAVKCEQEFRFFALTYASLASDGATITTGRKAIIRSIYRRFGQRDTINVMAMLDAVITREEEAGRRRS